MGGMLRSDILQTGTAQDAFFGRFKKLSAYFTERWEKSQFEEPGALGKDLARGKNQVVSDSAFS
jgi:hypothetical protein